MRRRFKGGDAAGHMGMCSEQVVHFAPAESDKYGVSGRLEVKEIG
jgi:hypothetical protein